jgi:FkbM family methyltransferase
LAPLQSARRFVACAHDRHRSVALAAIRTGESLVRREFPSLSSPLVKLGSYDAAVFADLNTPTGLGLLRYGFHDPVAWAVHQLVGPGDCFIDAGANIGLMTLVAASRVGPSGRVISCEPAPGTAERLRRNVRANAFDWVSVEQAAVGEADGRAELVEFEPAAGLHSFAPADLSGGRTISVDVVLLDDLARMLPVPPGVVKLDVEGAECKALRGARELLAAGQTSFVVEVEPGHLQRQGATVRELREAFAGYAAHVIAARGSSFELRRWEGRWEALPGTPNLVLCP